MKKKKTSVSIGEIITGTYYAPLGMSKGLAAILIGHIIGCTLLFFAGLIGCYLLPHGRYYRIPFLSLFPWWQPLFYCGQISSSPELMI